MTGSQEQEIRARAEAAGQGHLFATLDRATPEDRAGFFADLAGLDWELVVRLQGLLRSTDEAAPVALEPAPSIRKGEDPRSEFQALEKTILKAEDELLEFAGL